VPGHYTLLDFIDALSGGMLTIMAAGVYGAVTGIVLRTLRGARDAKSRPFLEEDI
jgi:hypothetical protein